MMCSYAPIVTAWCKSIITSAIVAFSAMASSAQAVNPFRHTLRAKSASVSSHPGKCTDAANRFV